MIVPVKPSALYSKKNQTLQGITVPAGSYSFIFESEIFVYIPDHIVFDLSFLQPKAIKSSPLALKTAP